MSGAARTAPCCEPIFVGLFLNARSEKWKEGESLALEYELKFGPLGRLMDRFMVKRQFDKVVPAILSGLKRHMERGARSNVNGKPIRKELNHV